MASLNQAWNITTGALAADQTAISVVAGNIANANTPGYTTQTVQWGTVDAVSLQGGNGPGGAAITAISSQRDRILNQRLDQQTQDQAGTAARLAALSDLQSIFAGAIGTANGVGSGVSDIGQQMTALFTSFSSLAADPTNTGLRSGVLSAAAGLASTFNQVSASLAEQRAGLDSSVASAAQQINSLTSNIATLNAQISSTSPAGDAGTLEDRRQYDLQQLSQLIGIHQITNEDNGLTITTAAGAVLVAGGSSNAIQQTTSGGVTHLWLNGEDQTAAMAGAGGQIGGALEARDTDLPAVQATVDGLAWNVANAINTQQESGTDANGAPGTAIFSTGGSEAGCAAHLSVSLTDPAGAAASASGAGTQDGSNATAMAALANSGLVMGVTPGGAYGNLVAQVGSEVSDATALQASQSASLTQLQTQQSALSSVSLNDQAALLETYEQSYQAAAKVFTILSSVATSALNLGVETAVSG